MPGASSSYEQTLGPTNETSDTDDRIALTTPVITLVPYQPRL
jgi:hypothetical protein